MFRNFTKLIQKLCYKVCNRKIGSKTSNISDLADELIVEILSRLPADSVLSSKAVCKSWCGLSSTLHFNEMHQRRATNPVIVFNVRGKIRIYSINDDFDKNPNPLLFKDLKITSLTHKPGETPSVRFSCDGLLVVKSGSKEGNEYAICNPVTREEVGFSLETDDVIYGFFFHLSDQEYKLLIYNKISKYFLYGLSTKDKRPACKTPRKAPRQETQGTKLGTGKKCLNTAAGVTACGALFWNYTTHKLFNGVTVKLEEVLMFDFETENFKRMPQPADRYKRESRTQTKLLEFQGELWCCDVYDKYVEVFILEDVESWRWNKRHVVHLDRYINKGGDRGKSDAKTTVVGIQDRNLVLSRSYVGLLWCNLLLNSVTKIEKVPDMVDYISTVNGVQYTSSSLSLRKLNILPDTTRPSSV